MLAERHQRLANFIFGVVRTPAERELVSEYRAALITNAVTDKTDVRGLAEKEVA